jgi:hypothetical protein
MLNEKNGFFKEIVALEHPRFVMQYKAKTKQELLISICRRLQDNNGLFFVYTFQILFSSHNGYT